MTSVREPDSSGKTRPAERTRRDFLDRLLALGSAVWALGMVVPAAMFLWPARKGGPAKRYLDIDPQSLPPGSGKVVGAGGKPVLVLHLASGEFRALSAVCTHLGCIVHWDEAERRIACPCHAGFFAPDGSVVSGPPPRPLQTYPTRMVGDNLRVEA